MNSRSSLPTLFNFTSSSTVEFLRLARTYVSSPRIITRYEDLPSSYEDKDGLIYRANPLSMKEAVALFGKDQIDVPTADRILRIIHGRRVAGTLNDPFLSPSGSGFDDRLKKTALQWLRKHVPVDEMDAAVKRAEKELEELEQDILTDAQRLGLYKPNSGAAVKEGEKGGENIYGKGALDTIREHNKQVSNERQEAEEIARKKQSSEIQHNTGTLQTQNVASRVELRRPGENPWLKYYLDRAKVLPDVPPKMTMVQRLWPSALLAVCITAGLIAFTTVYTPPSKSGRMAPDMPPAAATMTAIIAANVVISILWRFPPAFRMLNKYFISVPGYPRAAAVLGNTFSHQSFRHLILNMIVLWFVGIRLHDDIGRANFLAIYLSAGALSTLTSLTMFTLRGNFVTSSMGASGAITGIIGAYLWLHRGEHFKVLDFPPDPVPGVPGAGLLLTILLLEIYQLRRGWVGGPILDHYSHLGGYATGLAGITLLERYNSNLKKQIESRHRKIQHERKIKALAAKGRDKRHDGKETRSDKD